MKSILLEIYYRSVYIIAAVCLIECFSYLMQGPQLEFFSGLFTFNYQAIDFDFFEDAIVMQQQILSNQPIPLIKSDFDPRTTMFAFVTNIKDYWWQTDFSLNICFLSSISKEYFDFCFSGSEGLFLDDYRNAKAFALNMFDFSGPSEGNAWFFSISSYLPLASIYFCSSLNKRADKALGLEEKNKVESNPSNEPVIVGEQEFLLLPPNVPKEDLKFSLLQRSLQEHEGVDFFFSDNQGFGYWPLLLQAFLQEESNIIKEDSWALQLQGFSYLSPNEAKAWFHLFIGYLSYFYCLKLNKVVLYHLLACIKTVYIGIFTILHGYSILIPGVLKKWVPCITGASILISFILILSGDMILMLIVGLEELQLEQLDSELI